MNAPPSDARPPAAPDSPRPAEARPDVLTTVKWYNKMAVYVGDELVYWGDNMYSEPLLKTLGYMVHRLDDVPTHDVPPEFDTDDRGCWKPPPSLREMVERQRAFKYRVKEERRKALLKELARLEEEIAKLDDDGPRAAAVSSARPGAAG